jgi:acyl-CoA reductase-like NAD-dependent aldehyde dehydrogenase
MECFAVVRCGLYIDGKWVESEQGKTFQSVCSANGEILSAYAEQKNGAPRFTGAASGASEITTLF